MRKAKEIKRVVLYERYSSDKQQETSIEGQDKVCTQFCERNGYKIIKRYVDRAASAKKNLKKRESFLKMISDAEREEFDAIVVYKMDRFSRDQFTTAMYTKKLTEIGIAIISASENLNTLANDGGMSMFMIDIVNAVASYYSEELAQKVNRGMRVTAEKCQFNGGRPPLGYEIKDKRYVVNKESAAIVKEAFERVVKGESRASIAKDFNRRGLENGFGKPFTVSSLQRMISNERYVGVYRFGDIRIENGMPRIIDDELFSKANETMGGRKTMRDNRNNEPYLLTGKLYCGLCGSPMVGVSATGGSGRKYRYYACSSSVKAKKGEARCLKKKVSKDEIESIVLNECEAVYKDSELKKMFVETFTEEFNKVMRGSLSEAALIEAEIKDLESEKNRILDAIIANPDVQSDLKERLSETKEKIEEKKERLSDHRRNLEGINISQESVQGFLDSVFKGENGVNTNAKIIDSMVSRIELYDTGEVTIYLNISGDKEEQKKRTLPDGSVRMIRLVTRMRFERMNVSVKGI